MSRLSVLEHAPGDPSKATTPVIDPHAPMRSAQPVLFEPARADESIMSAYARFSVDIEAAIAEVGSVLLRGFVVREVDSFREFAAAFGHPLLTYEFASTPRSAVGAGIYTSTEYPAHQSIPLHSEQAYTREWPMKIWFHCVTAAASGGETPIADNRAIHEHMPPAIRERFAAGVLYERNFGDFDVPWQQVFGTQDRSVVEAFCRRAEIQWEWQAGGALRTRQLCQGIETHPRTGASLWFNQAHLFHVSNLPPQVREALVDAVGVENLPRNAYFADGSEIPDSLMAEVREVMNEHCVRFAWQAGDVLMLDNMLIAHARAPFTGPRKVVVAMAQAHGNLGTLRNFGPGERR